MKNLKKVLTFLLKKELYIALALIGISIIFVAFYGNLVRPGTVLADFLVTVSLSCLAIGIGGLLPKGVPMAYRSMSTYFKESRESHAQLMKWAKENGKL